MRLQTSLRSPRRFGTSRPGSPHGRFARLESARHIPQGMADAVRDDVAILRCPPGPGDNEAANSLMTRFAGRVALAVSAGRRSAWSSRCLDCDGGDWWPRLLSSFAQWWSWGLVAPLIVWVDRRLPFPTGNSHGESSCTSS